MPPDQRQEHGSRQRPESVPAPESLGVPHSEGKRQTDHCWGPPRAVQIRMRVPRRQRMHALSSAAKARTNTDGRMHTWQRESHRHRPRPKPALLTRDHTMATRPPDPTNQEHDGQRSRSCARAQHNKDVTRLQTKFRTGNRRRSRIRNRKILT